MKKTIALLLVALLLACAACAPNAEKPSAEFTLTVETPGGAKEFTSDDAAKLTAVEMQATVKNKKGEETTSTYKGVMLKDVLAAAGVTDFTSLTIVAADDFTAEYDKALALKEDTLLAWEKDGKPLDTDPPLQMAPKTGTGNQFVKSTAKVIVNP